MNKICETCDTKNRLGLCDGREGIFKYCYRKAGSLDGLKETITPFNSLDELYDILNDETLLIEEDSLTMKDYGANMNILVGKYKHYENNECPMGFITK